MAEPQAPMDQLATLLEGERKQKALSSKNLSTRHSRFGTTIQVKAVSRPNSVGDMCNELMVLGRPEIDHAQAECYTCGSREDIGPR